MDIKATGQELCFRTDNAVWLVAGVWPHAVIPSKRSQRGILVLLFLAGRRRMSGAHRHPEPTQQGCPSFEISNLQSPSLFHSRFTDYGLRSTFSRACLRLCVSAPLWLSHLPSSATHATRVREGPQPRVHCANECSSNEAGANSQFTVYGLRFTLCVFVWLSRPQPLQRPRENRGQSGHVRDTSLGKVPRASALACPGQAFFQQRIHVRGQPRRLGKN